MSAAVSKAQVPFSLGNLSYINSSYEEQPAASRAPRKRSVFTRFREWRHRGQIAIELSLMTDRELADIGLSRADLSRVFDPAFTNHACDRGYIGF